MVISTHVYVEHPDLGLAHTIRSCPGATVSVLPSAGTDPRNDGYLFWIDAPNVDTLESSLEADRSVREFRRLDERSGGRTYRITYSENAELLTPAITDCGGLTQEARSHDQGWVLRLQLRSHEALTALDSYATERGIHLEILELRQEDDHTADLNYGLTDAQMEALVAAYVHGYYEEPRKITLEELAATLDRSNTAVSGRLRRGAARLIEAVVLEGDSEDGIVGGVDGERAIAVGDGPGSGRGGGPDGNDGDDIDSEFEGGPSTS